MNFRMLIILSFILLLSSCQDGGSSYKANSYDLVFYAKNDGTKPAVGEYAFFQMDILNDKKELLQSYRNQKRMPSIRITEPGGKIRNQNPIPEALAQMSINDSVGIIIPRDSIPDLDPSSYEELQHLEYVLVLKEILSESMYQQRLKDDRDKENELMAISRAKLPEIKKLTAQTLEDFNSGKLDLKYTENGVAYYIHETGKGEIPTKDRLINAHYYGMLQSDGRAFDNSFERGRAFSFRVGRGAVIKGWDEGFLSLPVGTKASLFIPSEMGYGVQGSPPSIPGNADLYFYVELEEMFY